MDETTPTKITSIYVEIDRQRGISLFGEGAIELGEDFVGGFDRKER
ncbi:MAG: hypothetical protein HC769_02020 [Cyanobacteria bacterium CRU_2_1]|nr:hypothetical protein [Cyanobacteria bacterium RU_5_0]NJR57734.1 hypothetical protein [Cyanobacteria bacterium CRU_2_1]